jgi:hypothetical protein
MELWHGKDANVKAAQQAMLHRAQCNRTARRGPPSQEIPNRRYLQFSLAALRNSSLKIAMMKRRILIAALTQTSNTRMTIRMTICPPFILIYPPSFPHFSCVRGHADKLKNAMERVDE